MPPILKRTIEKMDLMGKKSSKVQDKETYTPLLRRLALILVIGYAAAVVLFYFLAGEQLHLRQSRDNTELPKIGRAHV